MACILIIDDDEAVRSATKIVLDENGFDVVTAADGKSGINAVKDRQFDAIIVDLFMPGMDGLATTKAIRKLCPLTPIPSIFLVMLSSPVAHSTAWADSIPAQPSSSSTRISFGTR